MERQPSVLTTPETHPSLGDMIIGYTAACATSAAVITCHFTLKALIEVGGGASHAPNPFGLFFVLFGFSLVAGGLLCIPGFVVLRWLLYVLSWRNWAAFGVAGALLGGAWTIVMGPDDVALWWNYPPSPVFIVAGGAAGLAAWVTENRLTALKLKVTDT